MKAIHFGAGNIGRGFIGYLLKDSNYDLVFVDANQEVVDQINDIKQYNVNVVDQESSTTLINDVKAFHLNDVKELKECFNDIDLVTLSIGINNILRVAPLILSLIEARYLNNPEPKMDIIACENALYATNTLKEELLKLATDDLKTYILNSIGFPNSAVDRIVPNVNIKKDNPLDVFVEAYYEWDIEAKDVLVNQGIVKAHYVKDLQPYLERKLFLLNGAHATVAYVGYQKNYATIDLAINDEFINLLAFKLHDEAIAALLLKHDFTYEDLQAYSQSVITRFNNPYLQDDCARVAKDPLRKLGHADRLIPVLKYCFENKIPYKCYLISIAYALVFLDDKDPSSVQMHEMINENGIKAFINGTMGLDNEQIIEEIITSYQNVKITTNN